MQRYLLFDAGCTVCNQLADAIGETAAGKLKALSIRDPQAREWLEQVYPEGWDHRPYLVTVDGDRVQAHAGAGMALRLGWLLGPRKAWRVWNLARQYGVVWPASEEFSAERRGFLKRAALFVGSLFFFPRLGSAGGQGRGPDFGRPDTDDIDELKEQLRNARTVQLQGSERGQALSQALNNDEVRLIRATLIAEGFTPRINEATAYRAMWEANGHHHDAIAVVIPLDGDGDYTAIYYGDILGQEQAKAISVSGIEAFEDARAAADSIESTSEVHIRFYYVEEGIVQVKERIGNPCTFDCIACCAEEQGLSPLAVAGCIAACLSCYGSALPACVYCGACGGVVVGCAGNCCVQDEQWC